jgi:hypothetical protein
MLEMLFAPEMFDATEVWEGSNNGEEEFACPTVPTLLRGLVTYTVRA